MAGDTWTEHINGPIVDIELFGDSRAVDNMLRSIYDAFLDEALAAGFLEGMVAPALHQSIEDRFDSEGDAVSGPWTPLAEATIQIRGSAHPINVRTGQMRSYLTHNEDIEVHSLGATMWIPGRRQAGQMASKIRTAQQGGVTPQGRPVPPRPVLGFGANDLETIMAALAGYLGKAVAAGGATVNWL